MADNYSGAQTAGLAITGLTTALSGNLYRCRATNAYGARYSDAAELTVNAPPASCIFDIPGFMSGGGEFSSLAEAQGVMADYVAGCISYVGFNQSQPVEFTASFNGTTLNTHIKNNAIEYDDPPPAYVGNTQHWVRVSVPDGTIVSAAYSSSGGSGFFSAILGIWSSDGDPVGNDIKDESSGVLSYGPISAGEYFLELNLGAGLSGAGTLSSDFSITCNNPFSVCSITALYTGGELPCTP